jgi:hypothetical protein
MKTPVGNGNRDIEYVCKLDRVLLIEVILPPLDKYILFQPANQCSIISITPSQINLALKEVSNGRPRYFIGKEETQQPRILASPSTLLTLPTRTNYDLTKFIFKLDVALMHKNRAWR